MSVCTNSPFIQGQNENYYPSVCIIIAYFGKLPHYADLWLKTCSWNKTIDFIVYTDTDMNNVPSNVKVIKNSFKSFQAIVKEKLKQDVVLNTPYECCDFKTVYGKIFEDYLTGYDYWGYCDMDMLFGDLRWFFIQYRLELYDKFQSVGHLTLFRNTKENNERYKLPCNPGKGYLDAFSTPGSTHFCESEINQIFNAFSFRFFNERIHADISPEYKRMRLSIRTTSKSVNYKYQTFYWQNGKVWRAFLQNNGVWSGVFVEEFMYIHFQKRVMDKINFDINKVNAFYVCPNRFMKKECLGYPNLFDIKNTNPYSFGLQDLKDTLKIQFRRISRRLRLFKCFP